MLPRLSERFETCTLDVGENPPSLVESEPRLFALPIETPLGKWSVVAVINLGESPINVSIHFDELELNVETPHHIFDFWAEQYEGSYERTFEIRELMPHTTRLLCVRPEAPFPIVLSTSMNYTQGGIELVEHVWEEKLKELSVTINKSTKKPTSVFIAFNGAWTPKTAHIDDEVIKFDVIASEVVAIRHQFKKRQTVRVTFT
jgi:hypothetical protein